MTRQRAIELLVAKLVRRRELNEPDIRKQRNVITGPVMSICLSFADAEALIELLRSLDVVPGYGAKRSRWAAR